MTSGVCELLSALRARLDRVARNRNPCFRRMRTESAANYQDGSGGYGEEQDKAAQESSVDAMANG